MLAVIGENVVDMVPADSGMYRPCLGGSPFNVALGAARQQIPVSYISPLSQDNFGQAFLRLLQENGARYGLPCFAREPSSLALVCIDAEQQPQYSLYRNGVADRAINAAQQIAALSSHIQVLHLGSLALEPQDAPRIRAVLHHAIAEKIKIGLDINVRMNAISDEHLYRAFLAEVIALSHYIKASDEDLRLLYPQLTLAQAVAEIQALAPRALLALTRGGEGATLYWQHHQLFMPVVAPTKFVDTVGAGDTFWANLLAALIKLNLPEANQITKAALAQCLQRATLAASMNIAQRGCNPPDSQALEQAFLQMSI